MDVYRAPNLDGDRSSLSPESTAGSKLALNNSVHAVETLRTTEGLDSPPVFVVPRDSDGGDRCDQ